MSDGIIAAIIGLAGAIVGAIVGAIIGPITTDVIRRRNRTRRQKRDTIAGSDSPKTRSDAVKDLLLDNMFREHEVSVIRTSEHQSESPVWQSTDHLTPMIRLAIELSPAGDVTAIVDKINPIANELHGEPRSSGRLVGRSVMDLVAIMKNWMETPDFDALVQDQIRAAKEFADRHQAVAYVPIHFNERHPSSLFKSRRFLPIMLSVEEDAARPNLYYAEMMYLDLDVTRSVDSTGSKPYVS